MYHIKHLIFLGSECLRSVFTFYSISNALKPAEDEFGCNGTWLIQFMKILVCFVC